MRNILLPLLFLSLIGCSQDQKIISGDYSFISTDGEVRTLRQSNDTLYELKCYIDRPCLPEPSSHYKIISATITPGFSILKLEKLDTIRLSSNPYPATRFGVLALRTGNNKELGYLPLKGGLTRQQLDTVSTDVQVLKTKFFYTFYNENYIKEFSKLKKITTKEEVMMLGDAINADNFKALIEAYKRTEAGDMYNSGISAELLTKVCLIKGYNPIGAGEAVDKLMK